MADDNVTHQLIEDTSYQHLMSQHYHLVMHFSKTLKNLEGKKGVVVTLLASLELAKDGYIELIQNKSEELYIKSLRGI